MEAFLQSLLVSAVFLAAELAIKALLQQLRHRLVLTV